jgi:hypothetical protein
MLAGSTIITSSRRLIEQPRCQMPCADFHGKKTSRCRPAPRISNRNVHCTGSSFTVVVAERERELTMEASIAGRNRPMVVFVTIGFEMRCMLEIMRRRCQCEPQTVRVPDPASRTPPGYGYERSRSGPEQLCSSMQSRHASNIEVMIFDRNNDVLIVNRPCIPYELFICLWFARTLTLTLQSAIHFRPARK